MARCTIWCGVIILNQSSATRSALQVTSDCDARKLSTASERATAGNSEKRRDRIGITNRRFDSGNAAINLVFDQWQRSMVKSESVIQSVGADRMARIVDALYQIRVGMRHLAN